MVIRCEEDAHSTFFVMRRLLNETPKFRSFAMTGKAGSPDYSFQALLVSGMRLAA
jgi:hypothetical protein